MNKSLIASYLAAGTLLFGGCGSNNEYHEGGLDGGTFKLEVKKIDKTNYSSRLELTSSDKKRGSVIDSVGAPIYSESPFTVLSMKVYEDGKLWRDYTPSARSPNSYYGPGIERDLAMAFEKNAGRHGLVRVCSTDLRSVLWHLESCKGKKPCCVPQKK